jgi:Flp pilus assembly protein TadD
MWQNPHFSEIFQMLRTRSFHKAFVLIQNYMLTHVQQGDYEELTCIGQDYQLLSDYWSKGYDDTKRTELYEQLLRRLYVYVANVAIRDRIEKSSFLSAVWRDAHSRLYDDTASYLLDRLQGYVSEMALLELEPEHLRRQKTDKLYSEHQQFMSVVFGAILTMGQMRDTDLDDYEQLLLSPTVDVVDQLHILSALTLSGMNMFCINKFRVLVAVSQQAVDEAVRQRALVGWVMCVDSQIAGLYPEIKSVVSDLCAQEKCCRELTELQLQTVYCMLADDDSQTIKNELMPDLIKGNRMMVNRGDIIDIDENSLEDILHPDAEEESMERMEASMKKIADMQRKGSDIYFAGFSQMKRFPFFSEVANWFVPFYPQHPQINAIWNNARGGKFLQIITQMGAFCDSDKYSFVLVFEQVLSRLPKSVLDMIERGEASPMAVGGEVSLDEQRQPAFVRRIYMQNLYRFYRLFPQRSEFRNPFDGNQAIFFADPIYQQTALKTHMTQVASFLVKQGMREQALLVLDNIPEECHDLSYHLLMGKILAAQPTISTEDNRRTATYHYGEALRLVPDNHRALIGYARAKFAEADYGEALTAFSRMLAQTPDNMSVELNVCVCLIRLHRVDEALTKLHKLHYLAPDNSQVTRVLAWAFTLTGAYEQANKLYGRLLAVDNPPADDLLNYGCCLWFQKKILDAVDMMKRVVSQNDNGISLIHKFMLDEHDLLLAHDITDVEIMLMLERIENKNITE